MEITSLPLSGRTMFYIVASLIPAVTAYSVLVAVARVRQSHLWLVPGWLAAAALAPVLSTFFGVREIIASFQNLAVGGGGIGAVSAGMWEATQPLIAASYLASALGVVTLVVALRAVVNQDPDESVGSSSKATFMAIAVLLLAFVAVATTSMLFRNVSAVIIDVIDPRATQTLGPAEMSKLISSRLVLTAGTAVVGTLVLLGAVVLTAAVRPKHEPAAAFARALAFVAVLAVLGAVANVIVLRSWAARLYETAMTGQVIR